jgi:hypothetical protein
MFYFFMLLAAPSAPACVLWIDHPPVSNDYLPPVCPLEIMLGWDYYNMRLIDENGLKLCEWPATNGGLMKIPCKPRPSNNYHIEVWLKDKISVCDIRAPALTILAVAEQCPAWLDEFQAGTLEIRGPYPIETPAPVTPACTLPQVDNSAPLATSYDYQFLVGRLSWWGIKMSQVDWQNRFNEQIRGAADAAGVPAVLLKAMIAQESQFWPLWTGDAGEVGWMQLTWDGADTALRHDQELFDRYCGRAIWGSYCTSYDLLTNDQRLAVQSVLIADLMVYGTPLDAAAMAADDLWIDAHILRAYACQAQDLYPTWPNVWQAAAVLYNAGTGCIQGNVICPQGQDYLDKVMHEPNNSLHPPDIDPHR